MQESKGQGTGGERDDEVDDLHNDDTPMSCTKHPTTKKCPTQRPSKTEKPTPAVTTEVPSSTPSASASPSTGPSASLSLRARRFARERCSSRPTDIGTCWHQGVWITSELWSIHRHYRPAAEGNWPTLSRLRMWPKSTVPFRYWRRAERRKDSSATTT